MRRRLLAALFSLTPAPAVDGWLRRSLLPLLAAAIVVAGAAGGVLYKAVLVRGQERLLADVMARNDLRARQLARSVAQQMAGMIRLCDMALLQLTNAYVTEGPEFGRVADLVAGSFPQGALSRVLVVDAGGRIVYSTDGSAMGLYLGDRPYFRFHAAGGGDRLLVSAPVKGRVDGGWVIPVSRAIRANGRFQGVIVISLKPEYLGASLASLALNPHDVAALVRDDGTFLARSHGLQQALGSRMPADRPFLDPARTGEQTYRAVSVVDQIPLDFAWTRLGEWPLIAVVGLDEVPDVAPIRGAIAEAERRGSLAIAAATGFSLVVAALLLRVQRQQRRVESGDERMRLFFERQTVGMAITSPQKGWLQVNDRLCDMLGYGREELARLTWAELTHPDDLAADVARFERLLAGEIEQYSMEKRFIRKDGAVVHTELSVGCVRTRDGAVDYVLALLVDVTQRKEAEAGISARTRQLAQQAEALAQSNAELEQFAYVASHDLREPLRMISSFLTLLDRHNPELDAESREFLRFAKDGAQRMDHMVLALLDYSRIGRSGAPRAAVDSGRAVADALANLAALMAEAGSDVAAAGSMPTVMGNHDELTRLFQNLVGNAIKYRHPDRPPVIRITCRPSGGLWQFDVADNGIGIGRDHFDRIFMIFQRLHTRDQYEGTGIGLAVCRKIVDHHGGSIWVESVPGEGSTFSFTLPAA